MGRMIRRVTGMGWYVQFFTVLGVVRFRISDADVASLNECGGWYGCGLYREGSSTARIPQSPPSPAIQIPTQTFTRFISNFFCHIPDPALVRYFLTQLDSTFCIQRP